MNLKNIAIKKILFLFGLLFRTSFSLLPKDFFHNAFVTRRGSDSKISYQMKLGRINRLEIDFASVNKFTNTIATDLYQWICNLDDKFNWYTSLSGIEYKFYNVLEAKLK
jgi:hypothetical protein